MLPHDRNGLCRSDVVPRRPVVSPIGSVKLFLDDLLPSRKSVASAHGSIILVDRSSPVVYPCVERCLDVVGRHFT